MPTTNPVPSTNPTDLLFNAGKLDEVVNGTAASYTDRLGVSRRSLSGIDAAADNVLNAIGYSVPVAYASGISLTLTSQTVDYNGVIYAPKSSALPFITSSWGVDSAKFRAIQVTDADLITYTPAGTGAVATTVQENLRLTVNASNFGLSSSASKSSNTTSLTKAIDSLQEGGWLILPAGVFDADLIVTKSINIVGSGKPRFNGSNLVGGTILNGKVTAYENCVHLGWFGIDQSGITDADGIVTGSSTDTDRLDNYFHDLVILGRGNAGGSLHGIVAQGGEKVHIDRCDVFKFYHGIALRVSYSLASRCYIEDTDATAIIIKSGSTFPANACNHTFAVDCVARSKTAGKCSDFYVEASASGYQTNNVGFTRCTSIGSSGTPFLTQNTAGTGGTDLRNVEFDACKVFGATGSRGFKFLSGDQIKVRGCHVEGSPSYSYGGDGASGVSLMDCTSRSPSSGHYIGAFQDVQINGNWTVKAGTAQDGGAISVPAGVLKTTPMAYQIESTTTDLFWVNGAGVRKTIQLL